MSRVLAGFLWIVIGVGTLSRPAAADDVVVVPEHRDAASVSQPAPLKVAPLESVTCGIQGGGLEWKSGLLGGWCGRARLAERGFTYSINSTMNVQYNASGGIERGGAVANRLVAFLDFNLGKLTRRSGLSNSSIRASGAWHAGTDINEYTGTFFKPDTNFLDPQVRLFELYWSQYFASRQVNLHLGRIAFGPMEFAMTPLMYDQLSAAFSSNPGAIFANQPVSTFSESVSTWGARVLIEPNRTNYSIRLGVYNGWPRDQGRTSAHGLDWSLNLDQSTFFVGEFAYKVNQQPGDRGLPGNYKVGVMHDTGPFERFDAPGTTERGNTGYYFIFDQMLFSERVAALQDEAHPSNWPVGRRWSHPKGQGLYVWGSVVVHPDESVNLFPYWLTGSLHYKGPFSCRAGDRVGIGYRHGFATGDLSLEDESSLEAFYAFQVNTWFRVSPNVQYIWNPSGGAYPNALVAGFQVSLDL